MRRTRGFAALSALLALATSLARSAAALGCTSGDATAKRIELSGRLHSVMMQDPARGQALIRTLQAQMAAARQDSRELDWTTVCAQYDTMLRSAR